MPGTHHPFSPSSLERRIACPGSYLLEKNLPPMPENPDAAEGTRLHAACAKGDLTGLDTEQRELVEKCLAFAAEVCGSTEFKREVPLRLIGPGGAILTGGTADVAHVSGTSGTVVDYKFGRNEVPEAADNPQLAAYAAMLIQRYGLTDCAVYIFQPRLGARSSCLYRDGHVERFTDAFLNMRAACLDVDAPFHAGNAQCRYCKGAYYCTCPEIHHEMQTLAKNPPNTEELAKQASGEMLTRFVLAAEQVVKAAGYAKEELRRRARENNGFYLNCWELSPGRKTRDVVNIDGLHALVHDVISTEDFLKCCKVSIANLETIYADRMKSAGKAKTLAAGKRMFGELTAPLVTVNVGAGNLRYVEPVTVEVEARAAIDAASVEYKDPEKSKGESK